MKVARLGLLVSSVVLLDVSASRSSTLLSAAYSLSANASDPSVQPNQKQVLATGGDSFVPLAEAENGMLQFEGHAESIRGETTASLHGTARASIGSIGVSITGGVHGAPGGGAEIGALDVGASWSDRSVVRARGRSNGQPLVFNTFLDIDGEMTAAVSGTDRFGRPAGSAFAFLEIFASSPDYSLPTAPYQGGYWARIIENPFGNQHVVDEVPGAIRIRHVMRVGQPYTLAFGLHFGNTTRATAQDGVTSLLTAHFGSSLKWGGIESVTDLDGTPIPREDWSIESESGFDYSRSFDEQQIPEPAILTLTLIALYAPLTVRRRGRAANLASGSIR